MTPSQERWNDDEIDRLVRSSLNVQPSASFLSRVRAAVAETTVDQEIQDALNIEPSPAFVARVRMQIAEETPARLFTWPRVLVAAGVFAVALMALLVVRTTPRPPVTMVGNVNVASGPSSMEPLRLAPSRPEPAASESVTLESPPSLSTLRRAASSPRTFEPRAAELSNRPSTEVIVSSEEVRAFRQYLSSLDPDAFKAATVVERIPETAPLPDLQHLVIESIVVDPINTSTE